MIVKKFCMNFKPRMARICIIILDVFIEPTISDQILFYGIYTIKFFTMHPINAPKHRLSLATLQNWVKLIINIIKRQLSIIRRFIFVKEPQPGER